MLEHVLGQSRACAGAVEGNRGQMLEHVLGQSRAYGGAMLEHVLASR